MAEEDGGLLAITEELPDGFNPYLYLSVDGGKTWARIERQSYSPVSELSDSIQTPHGTYSLDGPDVVLTSEDGVRKVVYSSADWSVDAHLWLQSRITNPDDTWVGTQPKGMIYHKQSGNIILAALGRGVIVGTPDGGWTPVPVGRYYRMADFSPLAKTWALLGDGSFWLSIWTLPLTFTLLFLVVTASVRSWIVIALTGLAAGVSWLPLLVFGLEDQRSIGYVEMHMFLLFIAYSCAVLAIGCSATSDQLNRWRSWLPALTVMALVLGLFVAWRQNFGVDFGDDLYALAIVFSLFISHTCGLMAVGGLAIPGAQNQLARWRDWVPVLTVMVLVVLGVFVAWIQAVIPLPLAKVLAVALVALIACGPSISQELRRDQN